MSPREGSGEPELEESTEAAPDASGDGEGRTSHDNCGNAGGSVTAAWSAASAVMSVSEWPADEHNVAAPERLSESARATSAAAGASVSVGESSSDDCTKAALERPGGPSRDIDRRGARDRWRGSGVAAIRTDRNNHGRSTRGVKSSATQAACVRGLRARRRSRLQISGLVSAAGEWNELRRGKAAKTL